MDRLLYHNSCWSMILKKLIWIYTWKKSGTYEFSNCFIQRLRFLFVQSLFINFADFANEHHSNAMFNGCGYVCMHVCMLIFFIVLSRISRGRVLTLRGDSRVEITSFVTMHRILHALFSFHTTIKFASQISFTVGHLRVISAFARFFLARNFCICSIWRRVLGILS